MNNITFSGQLNQKDYRKINLIVSRKFFIFSGVVFLLLQAHTFRSTSIDDFFKNPSFFILSAAPILIAITIVVAFYYFSIQKNWNETKLLHYPLKGSVSNNGIHLEIEGISKSHYPWDLFLKHTCNKNFTLLFLGRNQFIAFFPRFFPDKYSWQEFQRLVSMKFSKK